MLTTQEGRETDTQDWSSTGCQHHASRSHAHTRVYTYTYAHTCAHMHIHACAHTDMHAYTYAHTHVHTHSVSTATKGRGQSWLKIPQSRQDQRAPLPAPEQVSGQPSPFQSLSTAPVPTRKPRKFSRFICILLPRIGREPCPRHTCWASGSTPRAETWREATIKSYNQKLTNPCHCTLFESLVYLKQNIC